MIKVIHHRAKSDAKTYLQTPECHSATTSDIRDWTPAPPQQLVPKNLTLCHLACKKICNSQFYSFTSLLQVWCQRASLAEARSHAEPQLQGRLGNACFRSPANSLRGHSGEGLWEGGWVNQSATCHINDSVLTKENNGNSVLTRENKGRFWERFSSLIEIKRHKESSLYSSSSFCFWTQEWGTWWLELQPSWNCEGKHCQHPPKPLTLLILQSLWASLLESITMLVISPSLKYLVSSHSSGYHLLSPSPISSLCLLLTSYFLFIHL